MGCSVHFGMSGIIEEVADGFGVNNSNAETFYDAVWLIDVCVFCSKSYIKGRVKFLARPVKIPVEKLVYKDRKPEDCTNKHY